MRASCRCQACTLCRCRAARVRARRSMRAPIWLASLPATGPCPVDLQGAGRVARRVTGTPRCKWSPSQRRCGRRPRRRPSGPPRSTPRRRRPAPSERASGVGLGFSKRLVRGGGQRGAFGQGLGTPAGTASPHPLDPCAGLTESKRAALGFICHPDLSASQHPAARGPAPSPAPPRSKQRRRRPPRDKARPGPAHQQCHQEDDDAPPAQRPDQPLRRHLARGGAGETEAEQEGAVVAGDEPEVCIHLGRGGAGRGSASRALAFAGCRVLESKEQNPGKRGLVEPRRVAAVQTASCHILPSCRLCAGGARTPPRTPSPPPTMQAAMLVKAIMVVLVAAATSGSTPSSSISGALTTPPPRPNSPATTPATEQARG